MTAAVRLAASNPETGRAACASENAEWWEMTQPFRHVIATNVFDASTYGRMSRAFSEIQQGRSPHTTKKLAQSTPNYDAFVLAIEAKLADVFAPLFSPGWLQSIARLFGIPFIPVIDGAMHSSRPGSRTGWIHSDYCSAWFHRPADGSTLLFPDRTKCDYFSGVLRTQGTQPIRYIRAATLIFYLNNDGWKPGDGGETELLGASRELRATPIERVPPLNNSLLIFPCSRHSYHRFVTNKIERNSIILWLHATLPVATTLFGPPTH